jgi:hypothetical protein
MITDDVKEVKCLEQPPLLNKSRLRKEKERLIIHGKAHHSTTKNICFRSHARELPLFLSHYLLFLCRTFDELPKTLCTVSKVLDSPYFRNLEAMLRRPPTPPPDPPEPAPPPPPISDFR